MSETRCTCGAGHPTFGACIRAKGLRIAYADSARNHDLTAEKAKDRELALYASARKQGIQPTSTKTEAVRAALDASDRTGVAFDAGKPPTILGE